MEKHRPNPDQLLAQVNLSEARKHRGKLRIYLGAAPGVGKTHAMLEDAIELRMTGMDIVIGVAESHGRMETAALMEGFERIPPKQYSYRKKELPEFDLDAAITRKPQLVLVDEMAHTNAPGARHTKRWKDIRELLEKGIDVYTTLNVQHIESLNDVVAQILNVHVRETVPDFMLKEADTFELVDLSPEDLLDRLHEGKVYFPPQAEIAKEHFFKKGNLIALRELALRAAAQYAGTQTLSYRHAEGIQGVWPTKEKILACIGPTQDATKIIRTAKRLADYAQTDWLVVYVDAPHASESNQQRNLAIKYLRLAEQLGAQTRILTGVDIVNEIMTFAREQNITQIVIGKKTTSFWRSLYSHNLTDKILEHSQEIDVHVTSDTSPTQTEQPIIPEKKTVPWAGYGFAISMIICATLINFLLFSHLSASDLIMVYVLASTIVAFHGFRGPAILASILGVLAYDFCFVPPFYSFTVENVQYFLTLIVMLMVTQIISYVAVLARRQSEIAYLAERNTRALYSLSHMLARTRGVQSLLDIGTQYIVEAFNCDALIVLATTGHFSDVDKLSTKDRSIAQWVYDLRQNAGWGTDTLAFADALFLPLIASQGVVGVVRISPHQPEHLYTPDEMRLLESVANQIALAIEVDKLSVEQFPFF